MAKGNDFFKAVDYLAYGIIAQCLVLSFFGYLLGEFQQGQYLKSLSFGITCIIWLVASYQVRKFGVQRGINRLKLYIRDLQIYMLSNGFSIYLKQIQQKGFIMFHDIIGKVHRFIQVFIFGVLFYVNILSNVHQLTVFEVTAIGLDKFLRGITKLCTTIVVLGFLYALYPHLSMIWWIFTHLFTVETYMYIDDFVELLTLFTVFTASASLYLQLSNLTWWIIGKKRGLSH